ncbi:MAG: hypothetical protein JRM99_08495 [Nitrososphaerota archaeon]|nr:hypothetical protein [Nitrososphaerota archaeon]
MTEEEEPLSPSQLREVGERALTFQRYVYRRAWGAYYAVWSAAFFAFSLGGELPLFALVPAGVSWAPYALLYGGVGLGAGVATLWVFRGANRAISLRNAIGRHPRTGGRRYYALIWVWWLGFYVLAFASFTFVPAEALSVLYASLFTVEVFIYFGLKVSFQDRTPFEGRLALVSYGVAVTLSFVASLFTSEPLFFEVVWGVTTATWLFCALLALSRAPEELAELDIE